MPRMKVDSKSGKALESCKNSAEILREARSAIRLADSIEQPSSLGINSFDGIENRKIITRSYSVCSDYSERYSLPDKSAIKKSQSINACPSTNVYSQIADLQPTVTPAALFERQPSRTRASYNKSNVNSPSTIANYGYTPSPTDGRPRLSSASSDKIKKESAKKGSLQKQQNTGISFDGERRDDNRAEMEATRSQLLSALATIRSDYHEEDLIGLKEVVLNNKSALKHGGSLRSEIMKELFKFMDDSFPEKTIKIIQIILELHPSGKNLTTILKVLYRLSEQPNIDPLLAEKEFISQFVSIFRELTISKYPQALLYGYGMLKNVTQCDSFRKISPEIHYLTSTFSKHLSGLTRHMQRKIGKQEASYTSFIYLLDVLKSLTMETEVALKIYTDEVNLVSELCGTMAVCVHDQDAMVKIVEILGKLARSEECCESFSKCTFCFHVCVQLIKKYFGHQFLVKGICYILGSLVATRKKAGLQLYQTSQALDVLLALLHHYVSNERNSAHQYKKYGKHNSSENNENNNVIFMVVRVLANMSCLEEVGQSLAKHTLCVDLLLDILSPKIVTLEKQVFIATLTTLSNMSYYLGTSLGSTAGLLCEKMLPSLSTEDGETVVEIYYNLSNLSHNEEVRLLLIKHKLIPKLLKNMEEGYLAPLYYASGVLLNLILEPEGRLQLHANRGISRIMAVIRDVVPDEWTVGTLLCQIIWNFAQGQIGQTANITSEEAEVLVRELEELIDEDVVFAKDNENKELEEVKQVWLRDFCPIAIELLEFLTSGIAHI